MQIQFPDDLPQIWSDMVRIRQILGNLLSNAVKYTQEGHVCIGAEVCRTGATPDGGAVAELAKAFDTAKRGEVAAHMEALAVLGVVQEGPEGRFHLTQGSQVGAAA